MALAFRVIKDVPTQQRIAERKRTSETGGVRIQKLTERKHGTIIFLTLRQ